MQKIKKNAFLVGQDEVQSKANDNVVTGLSLCPGRKMGLKQNVRCVKSPMSGFALAVVIFVTRQTPLLKFPKSVSSCQSGEKQCTYIQ